MGCEPIQNKVGQLVTTFKDWYAPTLYRNKLDWLRHKKNGILPRTNGQVKVLKPGSYALTLDSKVWDELLFIKVLYENKIYFVQVNHIRYPSLV